MRRIVALFLIGALCISSPVSAQTPPAAECLAEPRSLEELDAVALATPVPEPELVWPADGELVDAATQLAVQETLLQAELCAREGDLVRLLSLYTDAFIAREVLAAEPVQIVPGQPGTPVSLQPAPAVDTTLLVLDMRQQEDGSVIAQVTIREPGARVDLVRLVEGEDGEWLIDAIQPLAADGVTPDPEDPATAATGVLITLTAAELGVDPTEIEVVSVEAVDWPSSALGCPQPGGVYLTVITPGYRIVLQAGAETITYHTDTTGLFVRCEG